jgi:hypothetical protein
VGLLDAAAPIRLVQGFMAMVMSVVMRVGVLLWREAHGRLIGLMALVVALRTWSHALDRAAITIELRLVIGLPGLPVVLGVGVSGHGMSTSVEWGRGLIAAVRGMRLARMALLGVSGGGMATVLRIAVMIVPGMIRRRSWCVLDWCVRMLPLERVGNVAGKMALIVLTVGRWRIGLMSRVEGMPVRVVGRVMRMLRPVAGMGMCGRRMACLRRVLLRVLGSLLLNPLLVLAGTCVVLGRPLLRGLTASLRRRAVRPSHITFPLAELSSLDSV